MKQDSRTAMVAGVDLGDRRSVYVLLDGKAEVVGQGRLRTCDHALRETFGRLAPLRVAIEAGTHSPWVSRHLEELGHEVVVANPRQVPLITRHLPKSDETDAETLARLALVDRRLLRPISHRSQTSQEHLVLLRARAAAVTTRTQLINTLRGLVKPFGQRLPSCDADRFADQVREHLPEALAPALLPLLETVAQLSESIRGYDTEVARLSRESYPETERLRQVQGVGPITALTFLLTLETPERFARSRQAGAYLGLVPRRSQSGEQDPELAISRAGDEEVRRLLLQCAHYILGAHAQASDLRRWGLGLAERRGKKKAVVAVARKLAVLLHRLWRTGEDYEPLRHSPEASAMTS
ncbi:MAG TPA: IS110 family transposase [Longimicrobiales bacterium]|nr:IS110 family transposase [Longimicrobiales bacterium]